MTELERELLASLKETLAVAKMAAELIAELGQTTELLWRLTCVPDGFGVRAIAAIRKAEAQP